ncbi:hypothetical protein BDFB_010268, partial [Asbolus verrucosus]
EEQRTVQNQRVRHLRQTLESLEEAPKKLSEETQNCSFKNIKEGIWNMFKICQCNSDPLLNLLGDNTTIKDYNILFFQILEKQIQEYLIKISLKDKILSEKRNISHTQEVISTDFKTRTQIYPIRKIVPTNPWVEHELASDVIDTLQQAWGRKTTKERLK